MRADKFLPRTVLLLAGLLGCVAATELAFNLWTGQVGLPPGESGQHAGSYSLSDCPDPSEPKPTAWTVTADVQQLDLAKRQFTVGLYVCPGNTPKIVSSGGITVLLPPNGIDVVVRDPLASAISRSAVEPPAHGGEPGAAPLLLPVTDGSGPYPNDAYRAELSITLQLTDGYEVLPAGAKVVPLPSEKETSLPFIPIVQRGASFNGDDVSWSAPATLASAQSPSFGSNTKAVDLLVGRGGGFPVVFTYAIAALPMILVMMLFHVYALHQVALDKIGELLIVVSGVFLTTLPLRSVLVSSDVSGFTRVDMILAMDLALLVLAGAVAYARAADALPPWPFNRHHGILAMAAVATGLPAALADFLIVRIAMSLTFGLLVGFYFGRSSLRNLVQLRRRTAVPPVT